ncbi:TPA: hypothetical protein N0F65_004347 [Lagenidium giganteum]|uniref:Uncharacterized protein n=1 Tax=Lagenidium giganteum TaxID=4803 RepID=A0AAV2YMR3_9STRA|nr:TPA: hypothetical protein N0F65_004347 [Lagenidium giganteum]
MRRQHPSRLSDHTDSSKQDRPMRRGSDADATRVGTFVALSGQGMPVPLQAPRSNRSGCSGDTMRNNEG